MRPIKACIIAIILCVFIIAAISCKKKEQNKPIVYADRIVQDSAYRIGKWYSIMPWTNQSVSPYLDTIWFINDTLAGWSAFVPDSPYAYSFRKTYFPDIYHIAMIAPDPMISGKMDTGINECGMTATGDTFAIYWKNGYMITEQQYVKKTN
jgi:hypothetical protein